MTSFIIFTVIAIIAHVLVWMWRPWLPDESGRFGSLITDTATQLASLAAPFIS